MKAAIIFFLTFILFCHTGFAQVEVGRQDTSNVRTSDRYAINLASVVSKSDSSSLTENLAGRLKINWKPEINYSLSMSFNLSRGNLNLMNFLPKADLFITAGLLGMHTSIGYNFTILEGETISNDFLFDMSPVFSLGDKLNITGIMGAQAASTRNIGSRQRTGLGLGLPFKDDRTQKMNVNLNGVYEKTQYTPDEEGNYNFNNKSDTSGSRLTYGIQLGGNGQSLLGDSGIQLNYNAFFMKALNQKDLRISVLTGFIVPVSKKISFLMNINYSYENVVLLGTKRGDLFLTFGMGLSGWTNLRPKQAILSKINSLDTIINS